LLPALANEIEHWPAATVPVQLSVPSLTVTFPVGEPAPGALTPTAYLIVTACPTNDGSGSSEMIAAVVSALSTECAVAGDEAALALKFASPP
jgi:hypothetical protein